MEGKLESLYTATFMKHLFWLWVAVVEVYSPEITRAQTSIDRQWDSYLAKARSLAEKGQLEESLELLIRTRQAAEKSGAAAVIIGITMNDLGTVYHALGRHSDADRMYASAIRLLNAHNLGTHPVMSRIFDNQASLYVDLGRRFTDAERLRRRALELRISEVGPEGSGIAILLSNLGGVCLALGRFEEAESLYRRALNLANNGNQGAATAGNVLQNLAVLYGTMGRDEEAANFIGRAVESLEKVSGEDHPDLVRPLLNLAHIQIRLNRPLDAEVTILRAHRLTETRLGPNHPSMLDILRTLENILRRTNRKAQAREVNRRAAAVLASNPDLRLASSTVDISRLGKAGGRGR